MNSYHSALKEQRKQWPAGVGGEGKGWGPRRAPNLAWGLRKGLPELRVLEQFYLFWGMHCVRGFCFVLFCFFSFFILATLAAWEGSQARDWTCTTAVIQAGPKQWQHWILYLLHHQWTPVYFLVECVCVCRGDLLYFVLFFINLLLFSFICFLWLY